MCMIKKRDGREVQFNKQKIINAVLKAINNTGSEMDEIEKQNLANKVADYVDASSSDLSVEDIQDQVIFKLKDLGYTDISKAYSNYRKLRTIIRERNSSLMVEIEEKLTASNVQNQNANVDEHSFGGRKGEADSSLMKYIALNYVMSPTSRDNHLNNIVYIHDLDSYAVGMHNCLSFPLDKILSQGFNTRQTDVRPANSVNTALQLVAVLFQLQSLQQFGGVSATHLDWTLVPYIRKSLMKHYIAAYIKGTDEFANLDIMEMAFDIYEEVIKDGDDEYTIERNRLEDWIDSNKEHCLQSLNLNKEDFYFGSEKLDKKLYNQALYDTINETQQAVEGMYHNLNY